MGPVDEVRGKLKLEENLGNVIAVIIKMQKVLNAAFGVTLLVIKISKDRKRPLSEKLDVYPSLVIGKKPLCIVQLLKPLIIL